MKTRILILFTIFNCFKGFYSVAGEFRAQNLPSFCNALFPKIVPGSNRPLSPDEIGSLLQMTKLSTRELDQQYSQASIRRNRELLEKLMLLHWQVPHLAEGEIMSKNQPGREEVLAVFPRAKDLIDKKPEFLDKLARAVLKKKLWSVAERLASYLGSEASPQEQKDIFKTFLEHVDYHDQSWYHQAMVDSLVDLASGIRTKKISETIQKANRREFNNQHQGEETYSFAGPELLLTPYSEILNLFQAVKIKPGDKVVDLGAGFGRVGLALAVQYPGVEFVGYEIVKERIEEGVRIARQWGLDSRVHLLEQNLADPNFKPQPADVYYAFNPVSGTTFDKILEDLRTVAIRSKKPFRFIVFGPSPFYKTDAQPWLKELKGAEIPEGEELKIYEFVPENASHTVIVDPGRVTNPFQLRPESEISVYPETVPMKPAHLGALVEHLGSISGVPPNDAAFLSPQYLTAWASAWPMEISRRGRQILISSKKTDEEGKENFIEPLGGSPVEKAALIKTVLEEKKRHGVRAEFSFLSGEVYKILQGEGKVQVAESPEYDDFIYPAENLVKLDKTKRLRDRGHQADSFEKTHPEVRVELLSQLAFERRGHFLKAAHEFLDSWLLNRKGLEQLSPFERAQLDTENQAAKVLAERLVGSESIQMAIRHPLQSEGQSPLIAYAAGEVRESASGKRTLIIYTQKSDGTKNAIPFINRELVREVYEHPEKYGPIDYVNMMDGSTSGLRQFKAQYEPITSLGKTYRATAKGY